MRVEPHSLSVNKMYFSPYFCYYAAMMNLFIMEAICQKPSHGKFPIVFGKKSSRLYQRLSVTRIRLINAKQVEAESRYLRAGYSRPSCMFCEPAVNGKPCLRNALEVPAPYTPILCTGCAQGSLLSFGDPGLPNMMKWRALPGSGRA